MCPALSVTLTELAPISSGFFNSDSEYLASRWFRRSEQRMQPIPTESLNTRQR